MRQKSHYNIWFVIDNVTGEAEVSLNGCFANFYEIMCCKMALEEFTDGLTPEDIDEYNKSIKQYQESQLAKLKEDSKKVKSKISRWVYVYKSQDLYKIGRSKSEDCRIKKYITENPHELVLIHKAYVEDYIDAEKDLHDTFADRRHSREWFKLDELDIKTIKRMYA